MGEEEKYSILINIINTCITGKSFICILYFLRFIKNINNISFENFDIFLITFRIYNFL